MFAASKRSRRPGLALAILIICCLPVPAFSDEIQYLPDNVRVIASINVTVGAKTKTFQEFLKMAQAFGPKGPDDEVDRFVSKIARVTIGVGMPNAAKGERATEEIEIATAIKNLTGDEAKALKTPPAIQNYKKNVAFKEIKHGSVTIYQETYQTTIKSPKEEKLSEVRIGDSFYVAEGKYLVSPGSCPS